jgi:hypothetical protein
MNNERNYQETIVPFTAGDGRELNLVHVRGEKAPTLGPVLLVHGAGVRANIFRAPVKTTFVDALIEHGYDVWLENWRASIEFEPNEWTLDHAALYDHPAAVQTVIAETGAQEMKAVIHCQGSTSFTMSAMAGLVPQVNTIVSNAVSLHPVVPKWSKTKLNYLLPIVRPMSRYLNPHWGVEAPTLFAKAVNFFVNLTHRECSNAVCKGVSFTYGAGTPALWRHENLNEGTHEWLKEEFAEVPMTFFKQIAKCVNKGSLVSLNGGSGLPADFAESGPGTSARFAFFSGEKNLCFLPESQIRTHEYFSRHKSDFHTLHVIPRYGHLDIFMGQNAADDVYPLLIEELDREHTQEAKR